jgi:hypothetical protein
MKDREQGWMGFGKIALIAASHSWVLLVGLLAIMAMTYIAAYFLTSSIEDKKGHEITIKTPLLTIKSNRRDRQ